jgi:hypothetical protein
VPFHRGAGELRGLSIAGALARLNATSPAALDDDASELSLEFTASAAPLCVSIGTPARLPAVLQFPGSELAPQYAILEPLVWSEQELGGFEFQAEARSGA